MTRTEDELAEAFRRAQEARLKADRALAEARDFIYVTLAHLRGGTVGGVPDAKTVAWCGDRWLDCFGRDARKDEELALREVAG